MRSVFGRRFARHGFGGLDTSVVPAAEFFVGQIIKTVLGNQNLRIITVAAPRGVGLRGGEIAAGLVVACF